jgi:hypothetical protein
MDQERAPDRSEDLDSAPDRSEDLDSDTWKHDTTPIISGGAIPEGHEGRYEPSEEELLAGARAVAEVDLRHAQSRAERVEERLRAILTRSNTEGEA